MSWNWHGGSEYPSVVVSGDFPSECDVSGKEASIQRERRDIQELQDLMLAQDDLDDLDELTDHYFAPGIYARSFFIKKGHLAVGKIHKTEHLNIICKGKIAVYTDAGPVVFEGPCVVNAHPGIKKAVYALEDTTWINIHPTDTTDIEMIEEQVIAKDYDELENLLCHGE